MSVSVRPLSFRSKKDINAFIDVLWSVYADDPSWVPLPKMLQREALDPRKVPFLAYGEAQLFLAERDGEAVGRISAHINPRHDEYHEEKAGFFGFFDCLDDPEAAAALIAAAEEWLRDRDVDFVRGPLSFTINDEAGCLVEGFDQPPTVMNPQGRPHFGRLIEASGYAKEKDLFGWYYPVTDLSDRFETWHERIRSLPNIRVRSFDPKHLRRDVKLALSIYNDAWQDNWGFVPVSDEEADHFAAQLKFGPIILADPRITAIVELDGEPAAMIVAVPNFFEALRGLNGSLFPFGWARFYWRLRRGLKNGRVVLLGLKRQHMRKRALAGMNLMLLSEIHLRGKEAGYDWAELGWVLEDNTLLNSSLGKTNGHIHKVYRIFRKNLRLEAVDPENESST